MMNKNRPLATHEDWLLRTSLEDDPNCCMEDERGNISAPWQQHLCHQLWDLWNNRCWRPAPFSEDGKAGLWNQLDGKVCVPALYDAIGDIPELGHFEKTFSSPVPVCLNGVWGLVSPDGKNTTVLPFEYDEITYLGENAIRLRQYGKYGLAFLPLDGDCSPGFPCIADSIRYDDTIDRFVFEKDGRLGLVGVTDALFESFRLFDDEEESLVAVKDGRSGFLTLEGEFHPMDSVFLPVNGKRLHHYELSPRETSLLKIRDC